jgi:hypothetical protein
MTTTFYRNASHRRRQTRKNSPLDDEDSSNQRELGQPIQKMNEQAGTWNRILGTGRQITKVREDPRRCIENKLRNRNRYHAGGSDDQESSVSIAFLDTMKLAY